jgi:hypothetical protein
MTRFAPFAGAILAASLISSASGQTCYTPIVKWEGTYTLSGSGGGKDKVGLYSWTIDHQATGATNLPLAGASCTTAGWGGQPDVSATGSANDLGTNDVATAARIPCNSPVAQSFSRLEP